MHALRSNLSIAPVSRFQLAKTGANRDFSRVQRHYYTLHFYTPPSLIQHPANHLKTPQSECNRSNTYMPPLTWRLLFKSQDFLLLNRTSRAPHRDGLLATLASRVAQRHCICDDRRRWWCKMSQRDDSRRDDAVTPAAAVVSWCLLATRPAMAQHSHASR